MKWNTVIGAPRALGVVATLLLVGCAPAAPASPPVPASPAATAASSPAAAPKPTSAASPAPQAAAKPASGEPIKLGFLNPETGAYSSLGDGLRKGAEMFLEDLNQAGGVNGRPLEIVFLNDESNPERALAGMRRLIEQERVVAVLGPASVAQCRAVAPVVVEAKIPWFCTSAGYDPESPYSFGTYVHTRDVQRRAFEWMKSKGMTQIGMLAASDATGQVALDSAKQLASEMGITMLEERMNPTDVDVTPQLAKLRSQNPQAVIAWVTGRPMAVVVRNFSQVGLSIPLIVSHGNATYEFAQSVASFQPKTLLIPATRDLVWETLPRDEPMREPNARFHQRYRERFNREADIMGPIASDALSLITTALKAVGPDPARLRDSIESVKGFRGLYATFNFSPSDHRGTSSNDVVLISIKDGKFSLFTE